MNFNPRAPCGARQGDHLGGTPLRAISIHAPHAGRDSCPRPPAGCQSNFNPRAPCGARPPAAGAVGGQLYFNPRTPRGVRCCHGHKATLLQAFQSTRPVRGATRDDGSKAWEAFISIHAPLAGCDEGHLDPAQLEEIFQSTHPSRGATADKVTERLRHEISIHAPHAGRDVILNPIPQEVALFQSTRPMRGATHNDGFPAKKVGFQSTRPVRGATEGGRYEETNQQNFNPRAPCGARQQKYTKLLYTLLRQKAILRQFHAKRRLLKRFSTYKYRNTFLICSANRMGKICTLPLRTTRSLDLPKGMSACSQSARFCFRTFFPSSKTADYPASDP